MPNALALGFDLSVYPGDDVLKTWGDSGLFSFCGYYLRSPCHHDPSWMGNWQKLADLGFGLALVYVGQQSPSARCCSRTVLTYEQGAIDADDATSRASDDGLPPGAQIFLDVEHVDVVTADLVEYVGAWMDQMIAQGQFLPALYCHAHNADAIWGACLARFAAAGLSGGPRLWVSGGRIRYPFRSVPVSDPAPGSEYQLPQPSESGAANAVLWQAKLDTSQSFGGKQLIVDLSVSSVPDPSDVLVNAGRPAPAIPDRLVDFRPAELRMDYVAPVAPPAPAGDEAA